MKHLTNLLCLLILCTAPAAAQSTAFIKIEAGGTLIEGFSSVQEYGGEDLSDFIELKSFEYEFLKNARGETEASPFKITKYLDKATPLLARAFTRNERIDATIYVFDIDPDVGASRLSTTYTLVQGTLASIRAWRSPASLGVNPQLCEEVQITFQTITITHDPSSTETSVTPVAPR